MVGKLAGRYEGLEDQVKQARTRRKVDFRAAHSSLVEPKRPGRPTMADMWN
jgi:hypothetical protein